MIKFSTTIKFINMLSKMNVDLKKEFKSKTKEELGLEIIEEIIFKIPRAQAEFLELINDITGKNYTEESDSIEMIVEMKKTGVEIVKLFTQALKLNV